MNETILAPDVFDRLHQAMASDHAGFIALYRDFLADAWQTLRKLREAVQQQQTEEVRAKAHYLKSGSLILGAIMVAQDAARLEEMGRCADVKSADAVLEQTVQALRKVQAELSERLGAAVIPADQAAA